MFFCVIGVTLNVSNKKRRWDYARIFGQKIAETKKEIDRFTTRRQEELENSINFIENELQIERLRAQVVAYESVLEHLEA